MINDGLKDLNDEFGIPSQVTFKPGPGGLPFAELTNTSARATVALYAGQVINFTPANENPVLWSSDYCNFEFGKAIRGGIPICWPWFGAHPTEPTNPAHGFARTACWSVVSTESINTDRTRLTLKLTDSETTRAMWKHQFQLEIVITVDKHLTVDLIIRNTGAQSFTCTGALHSYFNVSDVTKIKILGLNGFSYVDLLDPPELKQQTGPITFKDETDRTYLDTTTTCIIEDPCLNRRIHIAKQGSKSTVIWNPWIDKAKRMKDFGDDEYMGMVCVEATNAHNDIVTVNPNEIHRLQTTIHTEAIQ